MELKKLTLKEELAQSFEKKSKEKIKMVTALIISNAFVFLLSSLYYSSNNSLLKKTDDAPIIKASEGYELIVLSVTQTLIDKSQWHQKPYVTILNENKAILVPKAKIISFIENKNQEQLEFTFEINPKDMPHLREHLTEKVIVVPLFATPVKNEVKKQMARNSRKSKYEVPFQL